ncbi:MAG: hypothetical protein ACE5OY_02255 [Candidatus Bathyarchaeia archaeon]
MKIGMMGAWNTDSGASIHAEFIGREWVRAGHNLTVFSFYEYNFHGTAIVDRDEEYVIRCFTTSTADRVTLDAVPLLTTDYEILVVQDLGMLPKDHLGKIFHWIKRRARTVNVIHDGKLSDDPSFYQFDWDAIVGFDQRYMDFLKEAYPAELLHIIPYPCHPLRLGDKDRAREKLNLPKESKIVFMFGPASKDGADTIPWISDINSRYPILVLVVTRSDEALEKVRRLSRRVPTEVRQETLTLSRLYDYLHASDALVINKRSRPHVVVSSTVFQCLGSGCPIIVRDSNCVETLDKEVLKFSTEKEFRDNLTDVFNEGEKFKTTIREAKRYVERNSARAIAGRYIKLFESLR